MIEISVQRITDWHHEACRVMTNSGCEGKIFLSHPHTNNGLFFLFTAKYHIFILIKGFQKLLNTLGCDIAWWCHFDKTLTSLVFRSAAVLFFIFLLSFFFIIFYLSFFIYHECEGRIEKSVPRITVWHHQACRVMTNGGPEGWIFLSYPHMNYGFFFLLTTVILL